MRTNPENVDELAKSSWNQSYNLLRNPDLWGANPVPYVQRAVDLFRASSSIKVIDFPCGDGRNTVPLAKGLPFVVAGDVSANALRITKRVLETHEIRNCLLLESDIFGTRFLDEQFDGVFCWDVLGHLKNVSLALTELLRICRRGGYIVGSLFAPGDSSRGVDMRSMGNEEYMYLDKFYYKFYRQQDVIGLLQSLNAEITLLELTIWSEPPHEGFREYPHEHQSWAFTIKKGE